VLEREQRWPLGFYEELNQALDACAMALGMPNFVQQAPAPDGSIVTAEEQRARWRAGLDPRSGRPRDARRRPAGEPARFSCRPYSPPASFLVSVIVF